MKYFYFMQRQHWQFICIIYLHLHVPTRIYLSIIFNNGNAKHWLRLILPKNPIYSFFLIFYFNFNINEAYHEMIERSSNSRLFFVYCLVWWKNWSRIIFSFNLCSKNEQNFRFIVWPIVEITDAVKLFLRIYSLKDLVKPK